MENETNERDLSADLQSLKTDLASVKDDLKDIAQAMLERSKERAKALKDKLAHAAEVTTEKTRECVQHHPLTSVGVALGVGIILGATMGSMLKRHR